MSNTVRITVRDLDGLGRYIDQFVQTGANTLNGIQFGLSDPAAKQNEARIKAIEDARAKAKLYAEAAGAQLGQVLVIQEAVSPMPIWASGERSKRPGWGIGLKPVMGMRDMDSTPAQM